MIGRLVGGWVGWWMIDILFMLFIYLCVRLFIYFTSFFTLCLTLVFLCCQNSMFFFHPNSFSHCRVTFMCDCVVTFLCLVHGFISRQFGEMESNFPNNFQKFTSFLLYIINIHTVKHN